MRERPMQVKCREGLWMLLLLHAIIPCLETMMSLWEGLQLVTEREYTS